MKSSVGRFENILENIGLSITRFNLVLQGGVADYAQTPHSVTMASYSKHKNGWRAQVYVNGIRRSKLFGTKTEAKVWATHTEAELRQQRDDARDGVIRFSALLDEYDTRVSVHKKGHDWELKQFVVLKRTQLADMLVHDVGKADISRWKDDRLSEVSGSTVNRQMNLLSHVFTKAIEWGYADKNPVKEVGRPKENEAKSRLATDDELEVIQKSSGWDGESPPSSGSQSKSSTF